MSTSTTQAQKSVTTLETTTADVLSLKLYNLTEIVKLAAFAAEYGRAGTEGDTAGVLHYVADELQGVRRDFTETIYGLAAETAKKGGAL